MNIRAKIFTAIVFLVLALAFNTLLGLNRLGRIEAELEGVAKKDVALMELTTSVVQHQLERGILLERTIRIAEELAFQDVSAARRDHLMLNAKITKEGFESLAQKGAMEIIDAKNLVDDLLTNKKFLARHQDIQKAAGLVGEIEVAHISYDQSVLGMMDNILKGGYEVSFEDINRIQGDERLLNKKLQTLLADVQGFVKASLVRAKSEQQDAVRVLWWCLIGGALLGVVFLVLIVQNIARPLKRLVVAANLMAKGQYDLHLQPGGQDEFGELSRAFNHMSEKISRASRQLQEQNITLGKNLEVTDKQKRDLERINADLDELLRILNHDIRGPLTNLTGYSTVLSKEYLEKLDERGQRCVNGIKRSTDKIAQMIDDLLEMKQIVNQDVHWERVDMNGLLSSMKERLQYKILENRVELSLKGPFPVMSCDKTKMGIVFLNLLNNAIKYSSMDKSRLPQIEIGYQLKNGAHEFYVRDNGIGIDPANHQEIFGLFKRLNSEDDGTGVGLTVVKAIVEEHGGTIRVDSALGRGSVFSFTIPHRASA